ncbi:MAG: TlyA family RNA methyltransferase [Spirochaetes bacterium]|nr:TlyA family RNA methyltransferase [Spirochaetota bacterium]
MKKRERLDKYMFSSGLSKSREKARNEILAGWVRINGETVYTPSREVDGSESIEVKRPKGEFISRGGEKLSKAINEFNIDLNGKVILDIGASTGGFTDCCLKNGAVKVYAVDVGYGQLDYSLRMDKRVVSYEKTNAKNINAGIFSETVDFICADMSFISFPKVYREIRNLFPNTDVVVLIKPQFEAESSEHKKGVVKSSENHNLILKRVLKQMQEIGYTFKNVTFSPVKGPKGNIEYLLYFNTAESENFTDDIIDNIVEKSHLELT